MLVQNELGAVSSQQADPESPIRIAMIGCGAVAREFHLPVLAGHEGVRLIALVDHDVARATELAKAYGVDKVLADVRELDTRQFDAALIATPPYHHAPCAMELMQRGIHVLVEKPMAVTFAEANAMVRTSEAAGVVLAVGLFRRLFPSSRMVKALVNSGALGRPLAFDIDTGSPYGWPLATLGNMRKEQAGGGVLIDIGPHVLGQLLYFFSGPVELLEYRDNALGGIESDCLLRLRLFHHGQAVDGRVELSRTRKLRDTVRIECERGVLELHPTERYRVGIQVHDVSLVDPVWETRRGYNLQIGWADEPESPGYEAFRAEIDDWVQAIRSGQPPQLSGQSVLSSVQLVEECYRCRKSLDEPWVQEGLSTKAGKAEHPAPSDAAPHGVPGRGHKTGHPRRVLITGAMGFIGCRTAEILQLREGWEVRALIHNPSHASRLARLPIEMVQGDLRNQSDVMRATEGCDAVVHCAIGTAYGQPQAIFAVTVNGTKNLVEAALTAGVQRFVHVSTVAVHGHKVQNILDESTPVQPPRGDTYAESKMRAEQIVLQAVQRGLPAVTLRPANIYGPFGPTLTIRPIQHLMQGTLCFVGDPTRPSNTVYVDNVVEAIVRGLDAPAEAVVGQAFAIGQEDDFTWDDFFGYFTKALGGRLQIIPVAALDTLHQNRHDQGPLRWLTSWYQGGVALLTSAEFRAFGRKFLETDPWGYGPRALLEHSPRLQDGLRRWLKVDSAITYRKPAISPAATLSQEPLIWNPIEALVSIAKARRVLGYAPVVSRPRAMELSLDWLRHARLVP